MKFKSGRGRRQPVLLLLHPLLLAAGLSRVAGNRNEEQRVCREESFGVNARDVALNCSDPSYAKPALVQWRWSKLSDPAKEVLLIQLLNGNLTKYTGREALAFSTQSCLNNGDCTLTLKPRKEDTGLYHCVIWTNVRITETKIRLVYKAGDFKTAYIVAGACGGVLMTAAVTLLLIYRRKRARNSDGSFDLQMHGQSRENQQPLYANLNQAERELYSNLNS